MQNWIWATSAVLLMVVLVGRVATWLLRRGHAPVAVASQRGNWRVAPDAHVRAVQVLGQVHLVYERGRQSTPLESLSIDEFEQRLLDFGEAASPRRDLFRGARPLGMPGRNSAAASRADAASSS